MQVHLVPSPQLGLRLRSSLSLSLFSLILFSVLLIGCGSSGGGGSSNTNTPNGGSTTNNNNSNGNGSNGNNSNGTNGSGNTSSGSNSKELTSFTFANGVIKDYEISGTDVDITIDYTSNDRTPKVEHTGKDYSPKGAINFAILPKTYTITAEDNTTKDYKVTIRRAFIVSDETTLTNAIDTINGSIAKGEPISYITILVENDITLSTTKAIPSNWINRHIRLENYSINPNSASVSITGLTDNSNTIELIDVSIGTNNTSNGNNSNGTGTGNSTNSSSSKDITSFTFVGDVIKNAVFSGTNINIGIDYYSNNLIPTVTHTGKDYSPKGAINFANIPTTYTIKAEDNTTKDYKVTVRRAFVVSTETQLANAIDVINSAIASGNSINYITIHVTKDINLTGTNQRSINWAGRNIILEKYNTSAASVIISGLTLTADNAVGLSDVKIVKLATAIAAGGNYSLAIDREGKLWATGANDAGELGLGDKTDRNSFKPITISGLGTGVKITAIAAGDWHSLALDSNGKLWVAGYNGHGQLGLGNNVSQTSFKPVTISGLGTGVKIVSIAAGMAHSFAVDSNGKLWATGRNVNGQLGLGNNNNINSFQLVTIKDAKIVSVSTGNDHSLVLDNNSKVWASGYNAYGQLGLGNTISYNLFQAVTDGTKRIRYIAAGEHHSLAFGDMYYLNKSHFYNVSTWMLVAVDYLWVAGSNYYGQLGLSATGNQNAFQSVSISGTKLVSIAAGEHHSLARDSSGKIWVTGRNDSGQLGLASNIVKQSVFLSTGSNAISVEAGYQHSLVLDSDGKIWASGLNSRGQLGVGDKTNRYGFTYAPLLF